MIYIYKGCKFVFCGLRVCLREEELSSDELSLSELEISLSEVTGVWDEEFSTPEPVISPTNPFIASRAITPNTMIIKIELPLFFFFLFDL